MEADCKFRFCSYPAFVSPWLPEISLFDDATPHRAAMNMAIDEALLGLISAPLLRVYRWAGPAVSFGYFERWEPVRAAHPGRDAVRRWTGGGVVLHGEDFTYSLLIPSVRGAGARTPADSYRLIHGALRRALADAGIAAEPAPSATGKVSHACFENPVLHDVLVRGQKVAGAAQRRTRAGLIHQGSIQSLDLPPGFGAAFAARLGKVVREQAFDITSAAGRLVAEKYGTRAWLESRR
jgi:lipoate-protein ligase A